MVVLAVIMVLKFSSAVAILEVIVARFSVVACLFYSS